MAEVIGAVALVYVIVEVVGICAALVLFFLLGGVILGIGKIIDKKEERRHGKDRNRRD